MTSRLTGIQKQYNTLTKKDKPVSLYKRSRISYAFKTCLRFRYLLYANMMTPLVKLVRLFSLKSFVKSLIAVLLGILLTFAFAPYEIFPLAILAPMGLLALWISPLTPRRSAWLGFLFGVGLFGAGVYWVYISIHNIGEVPIALSLLITAGLVVFLALYPAFVGFVLTYFFPKNTAPKLLCAFPALWVTSEWVRGWLFTGFTWLFLGYSQTNSPLRSFASIFSVYGVSLAVALSAGLLLFAYLALKRKHFPGLYLSLFCFFSIWIAGALLTLIPWTHPAGRPLTVALVQGNIPQVIKWSPNYLQLSINRYVSLTQPLWGKVDIIIWPETAIPIPLESVPDLVQILDDKATMSGSALIFGIPMKSPGTMGYYNALVSVGANKNLYVKRQLVPFGEYTPPPLLRFFDYLNLPASDILPGAPQQNNLVIDKTEIKPAICYEVTYPELMESSDPNLGLLLTVTNDAWFGRSNAQAQHLQMAVMRTIELGRPMLFVSNDGITAIIDAYAKLSATAPTHTPYVLKGSVTPYHGLTPWMEFGMSPIIIIILILFLIAILSKHLTLKLKKHLSEEYDDFKNND